MNRIIPLRMSLLQLNQQFMSAYHYYPPLYLKASLPPLTSYSGHNIPALVFQTFDPFHICHCLAKTYLNSFFYLSTLATASTCLAFEQVAGLFSTSKHRRRLLR